MVSESPYGRQAGFTLIELLITASIVAVAMGAIVAMFTGGLRVWEFIRVAGQRDGTMAMASIELQRDLRNAVFTSGDDAIFEGQPDSVIFVVHPLSGAAAAAGTLRRISYRFDITDRQLLKGEAPLLDPSGEPWQADDETTLVTGLEQFTMAYQSPEGRWSDRWQQATGLPMRVRFTLVSASDGERVEMTQSVRLPTVEAGEER